MDEEFADYMAEKEAEATPCSQSELIRRYAPTGLQRSDTIDDALARADSLSGPGSYSGQMLHNKDLRRLVLLAWEYRKLKHQIGA